MDEHVNHIQEAILKQIQEKLVKILSDPENIAFLKKRSELDLMGIPHGIHISEEGKLTITDIIQNPLLE